MRIIPVPEIYTGENSLNALNNIISSLNVNKVMVITGKNILKAGIYTKVEKILKDFKKEIVFTDNVQPDPDLDNVNEITNIARQNKVEAVIGLGGGSNIDMAKFAAALAINTGPIESYLGTGLLKKGALPIIAIPTTAGTGSEVTPVAVLTDKIEKVKKVISSTKIIPQYAILDPVLTTSVPDKIVATSGIDALSHAIEAYTSLNASDYTDAMALKAITLISQNLLKSYENKNDIKAREKMLIGSMLAGMAFGNAGVTAVHAFAYPVSGIYDTAHGQAISLMLPYIFEYNAQSCPEKFNEISQCLTGYSLAKVKDGICKLKEMYRVMRIPLSLKDIGVKEPDLAAMADSVMTITRLLSNNPAKIDLADAQEIYKRAYDGKLK